MIGYGSDEDEVKSYIRILICSVQESQTTMLSPDYPTDFTLVYSPPLSPDPKILATHLRIRTRPQNLNKQWNHNKAPSSTHHSNTEAYTRANQWRKRKIKNNRPGTLKTSLIKAGISKRHSPGLEIRSQPLLSDQDLYQDLDSLPPHHMTNCSAGGLIQQNCR